MKPRSQTRYRLRDLAGLPPVQKSIARQILSAVDAAYASGDYNKLRTDCEAIIAWLLSPASRRS